MLLIYLSCAWVAGIFLGSKFDTPWTLIFAGLAPLLSLPFLRLHKKKIVLASLCFFLLFGGMLRLQSTIPVINESQLQFYNDSGTVELQGIVSGDPEVRDKSVHIRLSTTSIKFNGEWQNISGTVLIFVPGYTDYNYGDVLDVTGRLETPPGLDDFDYRAYLANLGIHSTMLYPEIELLETGKGLAPLGWIYSLRDRLANILEKVLPEPQASLAKGIVLGIRGTIPDWLNFNLSRSGTAHILAISGLHLSIVAGILLSLGIWIFGRRRFIYVWLALGLIWLYAVFTGMNPPVIRAAIMTSLFLAAEILGRQRSAMTSLAFAAAVMAGVTPRLLWQASFQMSFLAMVGLIMIAPIFMELSRKLINNTLGENGPAAPVTRFITDSLSISLGAVLAVLPATAYYFGIVSFVAPLATFFALLLLPGIIVLGIITGIIGIVALPVAQVIGWLLWLFTSYMLFIIIGFAAMPASYIEVHSVNLAYVAFYYIVLSAALWLNSHRQRLTSLIPETSGLFSRIQAKWSVIPLLVIAVLVSFTAATMPDDNLHISFLDVGEGDAILIQTPNHHDILIDGGPSPQAICSGLSEKMPFWDRTIDLLILTHPHADHMAGLIEVLKRYDVKQILAPDMDDSSPLYEEWRNAIRSNNIRYATGLSGQQMKLGRGATLDVLSPGPSLLTGTESDIDNNGVVVRLSMGRVSFLLTADIWREAELELIHSRAELDCTVLKVAHHGSDSSTSQEILSVTKPQLAVISVGNDNRFGHPSDEVMNRLEQRLGAENIYRTDRHGTIEFTTDGERIWVRTKL